MFEEFIKGHIQFLIEDEIEDGKKYDLTDEDIKDIINDLIDDEYFWEQVNTTVLNKLEKYEEVK